MIKVKRLLVAAAAPLLLLSVACGGGANARNESKEWRGKATPTFAAFVDHGAATPAPPAANWAALGIDDARTPSPNLDLPRQEATPAPAAAATATPATAPVATKTPVAGATPGATGRNVVGGFASPVRGRVSGGPDRYRFVASMTMEGNCTDTAICKSETSVGGVRLDDASDGLNMKVEGVFVGPDRVQARCTGNFGGFFVDEEAITVGGSTWVKDQPSGAWARKRPQFCDIDERFADLSEPVMADGLDDFTVVSRNAKVNGVDASQYSMSLDFTRLLADLVSGVAIDLQGGTLALDPDEIPEIKMEMGMDVWLAKSGEWPVRLAFRFGGSAESERFAFNLTWDTLDVNNPSLKVDAPV